MSAGMAEDTCLQCEQSRAEVKENETFCGIEDGYEHRELVAEWPRHHWRDWSDRELDQAGIKPEARKKHRRTSISSLPYVACDDRIRGHNRLAKASPEFDIKAGQCWDCGDADPLTAALNDPEGHALVQAIHDRKAEG
ncbi:hypothetical protein NNX28_16915 [Arthrobacter sp. zg-Y859]|uniref:Uncharacterized protein n=1 Tax=Arthrobacter jinronghuae TaxID=2964609 RepID=A0ABT1NVH3_9MICC|nr:hypothetical protein [Arthrobacter jinronghuae]MCQ1951601.1 hypothetical protein [Arthrobacter jinronghuae]UWX79684.1 hypothetical protein N2K98_05665 [Arthrobacter jinronghuae]